jgi:hypothetical protein
MLFMIFISFGSLIEIIPAFYVETKLLKFELLKLNVSELIVFIKQPSFSHDIFLEFI